MSYRTIVIGTDGSITAMAAQAAAMRLAKRFRSQLVIASAYQPPRTTRPMAAALVAKAVEAAARDHIEAVVELGRGEPADFIMDVAVRRQADLVVVGNKDIGEARRIRLGGVPDRVAHAADSDVLIVATTAKAGSPELVERPYRRLLVGTDGSPTAAEAARKTFELALLLRASVDLVYVGDPIVGAITLEETAGTRPETVKVETHVVQGDPAEQICGLADGHDVDLIVVGNKGMSGARRVFLGSVPNRVAHEAPTDVLIVKTVDRTIDDIAPGHGGVVDVKGQKLAVYKDEAGAIVALSPRCTHMGCTVEWNDADRTWDCPCHGSRYGLDGEVIEGPAVKALGRQAIT